ncbi:serine-type endopeptidase [Aureococcus anophagefferens]|nr:serine-type endopeptidase [Aureococcus anophagefferens]
MYAALLLVTHALAAPYILSFGRYALKATHARVVERALGSRLVAAQLRPQRCSPIPSDFLSLDLPPAAALSLARRGFRLSRDRRRARRPLFAPRNESFLAFARTRQLRDAPARPQRRSPYAEVVAPGLEARAACPTRPGFGCFNYVLWRGDVDVLNLSVGGPDFADAPFVDKVRDVVASGVTVVSAIGNDGPLWGTLNSPADMLEVVGVGGAEARTSPLYRVGARRGAAARNPAMVRQCLHATAKPYGRFNATERASDADGSRSSLCAQGAGRIDAAAAVACAEQYRPRVTLFPAALDLAEDCPYLSPLCDQPLFSGGRGVAAPSSARWVPGEHGEHLDVAVPSAIHGDGVALWPWFGAVAARAAGGGPEPRARSTSPSRRAPTRRRRGPTFGRPSGAGTCGGAPAEARVWVALPIAAAFAEPPPRAKRVLWDATHSLAYPPIFATRDFLGQNADLLDWNGDTPETNFRETFLELRRRGFYVDVARGDLRCHDLDAYGALLIADPEDLFWDGEVDAVARRARVFWTPAVGGANVPALNKLLGRPGRAEVDGPLALGDGARFQSGNAIARFPAGGWLVHAPRLARRRSSAAPRSRTGSKGWRARRRGGARGRLVLFGDSGCLDEAHRQGGPCFPLLHAALAFAAAGKRDSSLPDARLAEDHARGAAPLDHPADAMLRKYSRHYAGAAHGPPPYDAPSELPSEPACAAAGAAAGPRGAAAPA